MRLLIDAGNTRIKWAQSAGESWTDLPAVPVAQVHTLAASIATLPEMDEVWVSNVAGEHVAEQIRSACAARAWSARFIQAQAQQCGVKNRYAIPEQLGCDRWAALIAAWHHCGRAALVVNCGTATTIDTLSDSGEFIGGLILPGIALMQDVLSQNTAGLPSRVRSPAGEYAAFPLNTNDAIHSGALQATCGAIQRQYGLLADAQAPIMLGGGAAQEVQDMLGLPVIPVTDLVLQGLKIIAQEASGK